MRKLSPLLLILLIGGLAWGMVSILSIRFGGGGVYPAGSSLRADRQGTRVLHDSLSRLRPVERNFGALEGQDLRGATVLILHATPGQLEEASWRALTKRGARVVFAMAPVLIQRAERQLKLLELTLTYSAPTEEMKDTPGWEGGRETTLALQPESEAWTAISNGRILERAMDQGSLVLVANSDLFSNQTLAERNSPALLARMIGPAQRIVFEESHFGIRDDPGVMVLVRRYGLTGLLIALVILAALFVWQAAYPLVPLPGETTESLELQSERTAQSGLAQLLRRGIAPSELMQVCEREWERFATYSPTQREAVRRALRESTDPAGAFARATLALERKR